jgi:hypothetical protein
MIEVAVILAVAGLVVLMWPASSGDPASVPLSASLTGTAQAMPSQATSASYQSSMLALAHVRSRLLVTDNLDDAAKKSIDAITLALVNGSDK